MSDAGSDTRINKAGRGGYREIIAGFDDPLVVHRAAEALREAGFKTLRVDRLTQHPTMPSGDKDNAGYPATFTGESDRVARAGLIASTAVSGMAVESDPFLGPGSYDPFPGSRYVITVVIEAPEKEMPGLVDEAGAIIRSYGGST
ncbi:MAG TPA: hypothetical protein VGL40_10310 [Bacillota bacterium]|jgi:hypothetical protein